ncbi:energy transducer TonB [Janthinobacterium sp. PLB04]|uniref:Energy transducer TonB n=1 Tax=Janthinobacterium lividum TaxID=29581 RepID=A0AAJ4MQY9_9BURK|nr:MULTISPECIES: energy transducer TonB [Janthinobacterium]KAB0326357.1 energy transducer TonB [Janthinobacterium lividum]QSX95484.1 energy transducer TonB [Janthinobacterium lividum]UGQ35324.1 energy transducer TonB [Janthinobacterium sp. PLB04]
MNPRPVLNWGIATALVVAGMLALLLWTSWHSVTVAPANPAASVMVVFAAQAMSPETQVAHAVGARQSAASSSARPPRSAIRQEALPVLARAAVPEIVAAEKEEKAAASPSTEPGKDAAKEVAVPAQASSSATPAPAAVRGPQAAPFNSDTPSSSAAPASWQSRVLVHLAHFKRYPGDARQRKRAGAAWVRFQVDRDGKLLASELVTSSGTVLLDREALQVLERAQPLPAPPDNVLHQGTVTVTLPVSFKLEPGQDKA